MNPAEGDVPEPPQPPAPIPITWIAGFLGAGKTTVLNNLLPHPAFAGTLVLVNEFGEIALDHDLIEAAPDSVVLLPSGCLCCAVRGDLMGTLEDLLRRRDNGRIAPFSRILVEPTGLADPTSIVPVLARHPYLKLRFRLDGVIAVVDAVHGLSTLDQHPEATRQVVMADRIVLTKCDLLSSDGSDEPLRRRLAALSPGVPIVDGRTIGLHAEDFAAIGAVLDTARTDVLDRWLATGAAHREVHAGIHVSGVDRDGTEHAQALGCALGGCLQAHAVNLASSIC